MRSDLRFCTSSTKNDVSSGLMGLRPSRTSEMASPMLRWGSPLTTYPTAPASIAGMTLSRFCDPETTIQVTPGHFWRICRIRATPCMSGRQRSMSAKGVVAWFSSRKAIASCAQDTRAGVTDAVHAERASVITLWKNRSSSTTSTVVTDRGIEMGMDWSFIGVGCCLLRRGGFAVPIHVAVGGSFTYLSEPSFP
nr:hypothetical protein NCPCFENI_00782 [Cupriavidus sp.]